MLRRLALVAIGALALNPSARAAEPDWRALGDEAVSLLTRYVRLDTSNPPGNERIAADFFAKLFAREGIPSQIYESALAVGIAAACLLWVHGRKKYDGQVFVVFMGLYALGRFLLEFLRADDRGAALGLSTSQLIGVVLGGLALLLHRRLSARAAAA